MSEPNFHIQCASCLGFTVMDDEESDTVLQRMIAEDTDIWVCDECKRAARMAS